jgi:hypothetical protein
MFNINMGQTNGNLALKVDSFVDRTVAHIQSSAPEMLDTDKGGDDE